MSFDLEKTLPGPAASAYAPAVILALMILCAFLPALGAGFINYDDQEYVTANAAITGGISVTSLKWAFTAVHSNNWHPLTWISHLLDVQIYGLNPVGHHLTSLTIHIVNALLVALLFLRLTGDRWLSGALAALFALHPLRVESVAWVAERKDLLCGFFWLLAILLYLRYVQRRTAASYLLMAAVFICSLLAKPMAVTLPLVLLLLDLWPLGRFQSGVGKKWLVLVEKIPLILCSLAVSLITLKAQAQAINAVAPADRLQNALCAYAIYLGKHIYPVGLAPFYPYRSVVGSWQPFAAGMILVIITAICLAARKRLPQLLMGWSWYVVTLVPVIGIVQVGNQAFADRYTYLPGLGLLIMLASIMPALPERFRGRPSHAAAFVVVAILGSATFVQAGYWHDSTKLFRHTIAVTGPNYLAHYNLGSALLKQGELAEAESQLQKSTEIEPDFCQSWSNLGAVYGMEGRLAEAADVLQRAIVCDPLNADAHYNLGKAWIELGEPEKARHEYQVLSNLQPEAARKLQLSMR